MKHNTVSSWGIEHPALLYERREAYMDLNIPQWLGITVGTHVLCTG